MRLCPQPILAALIAIGLAAPVQGPARADGEKSGVFDYYVMALSWSANWCEIEGDAKRSPQCDEAEDFGWTLHGLWPQFHRGWPAFCPTVQPQPRRSMTEAMAHDIGRRLGHRAVQPQPRRSMTEAMADIMGTSGLAWYQWKKHGVCSGLSAADYYALSRRAYDSVQRPAVFRKLQDPVRLPAAVVEQAFLKANPGMEPDMVTVTCRDHMIQEVRICLSRDLTPVPCGRDAVRDCTLKDALFNPVR